MSCAWRWRMECSPAQTAVSRCRPRPAWSPVSGGTRTDRASSELSGPAVGDDRRWWRRRDLRNHARALAGVALDAQAAVEERNPLLHAGQPHALARAGGRCVGDRRHAPTPIADFQAHARLAALERDAQPRAAGMLTRV